MDQSSAKLTELKTNYCTCVNEGLLMKVKCYHDAVCVGHKTDSSSLE